MELYDRRTKIWNSLGSDWISAASGDGANRRSLLLAVLTRRLNLDPRAPNI